MTIRTERENIPLKDRPILTVREASVLFGISEKKIYRMAQERDCSWVIYVGSVLRVKRQKFEQYLTNSYSI